MPQLMAKSESPVGLLGPFVSKLSSKTYAQFARKRTEDTPRYTHTHTQSTLTCKDTRKLPLCQKILLLFPFHSVNESRAQNGQVAPLSLSLSCLCALLHAQQTHTRTHMYVCSMYWIKKQNLVKDKARSAAKNSWAAVWSSCCRCCYCYCCCCRCCCCYRSLYVH